MSRPWAISAAGSLLALVSACLPMETEAYVEAYPPYYAEVVPPDVYARPYVYYEGYPAYWVDDRWYYAGPRGWTIYRQAPPVLERRRPYVQQAPPAPRAAPYAYPPPAVRVR